MIESCDIEYNDIHPGNSDSKVAAADPGPALNGDGAGEASPTKVEENGIIHDVEQRLIINDGKSENFTLPCAIWAKVGGRTRGALMG